MSSDSEKKVFDRLEELLAEEYGLSRFKRAMATQYIKRVFGGGDADIQFRCVREWLRQKLTYASGVSRHIKPLSSWQQGCPQIMPLLRARAFWDTGLFPWIKNVEAAFPQIRSELLSLRDAQKSGFQPYRAPTWASKRRADDGVGSLSHEGGNWNVLYLELHNIDFSANREKCPITADLMAKIPRAYGHTFFSAMASGTHITPHHGPTNKKLRCHLPLVVPPPVDGLSGTGCCLRVGDEEVEPIEGRCYIFDDSLQHEARNSNPSGSRIVLIFDIWHPDLSDQEIKFLSYLQSSQMRRDRALCEQAQSLKKTSNRSKSAGKDTVGSDSSDKNYDAGKNDDEENDNFYSIIERAQAIEPSATDIWSGTTDRTSNNGTVSAEPIEPGSSSVDSLDIEKKTSALSAAAHSVKYADSPRTQSMKAIKAKREELSAAKAEVEKHRLRLSNTAGENSAKVRQLLKCPECATKEGGMCDSCRKLFLSKEWKALHPAWELRNEVGSTTSLDSVGLSVAPVKSKARLSERELIDKLGAARDREQSLLEELDAYKRALRFARNFIELEQYADTSKIQALTKQNLKLKEAVTMYQKQLAKVSLENEKLSCVLQEIVTGPGSRRSRGRGGNPGASELSDSQRGNFSMSGLF